LDIYDLGAPMQTCEMCETVTIRYVHVMRHPNYAGPLECGCICAGNMEQDLVAARQREHAFVLKLTRRDRLLSRTWRLSAQGNEYINAHGHNMVVFPYSNGWSARIEERVTGQGQQARHIYATDAAAKRAVVNELLRRLATKG
jgi:hypothetical protein